MKTALKSNGLSGGKGCYHRWLVYANNSPQYDLSNRKEFIWITPLAITSILKLKANSGRREEINADLTR